MGFLIVSLIYSILFLNIHYCLTPACHDYYDHVCETQKRNFPPKLRKSSVETVILDVEQYQDYVFDNTTSRSLFEEVNPVVISRWLVELHTFLVGVNWENHNKRHERFLGLGKEDQVTEIRKALEEIDLNTVSQYYNGLRKSVENLRSLRITISRKNPFYHDLFNNIKEIVLNDIEKNSRFAEIHKNELKDQIRETKVLFAYFDYNNLTYWELAKRTYELEYYRLKAQIDPRDADSAIAEKAIRIAAIEPSVDILASYINNFTRRFVLQSVIASPTKDCFNYLQEIHISVLTKIDPDHIKEELPGLIFVIAHELLHSIYNLEPKKFELETWKNEKDCVVSRLKQLGASDKHIPSESWDPEEFIFEDLANIGAIRVLAQYVAQQSSSDEQIRYALGKVFMNYCFHTKNTQLKAHNPFGVSFNTAISELPIFKTLFNCTTSDRMFISQEDTCEAISIPQKTEIYEVQQVSEDDLPILSHSLNILEEIANTYGNTSSEIFEISDVEKEESQELDLGDASTELPISDEEYDEVFIALNSTEPTEETPTSSTRSIGSFIALIITFSFSIILH